MKQGWEVKKLGDLCNLMTGGTPSRSKPEYFIDGDIKWLVSGDIHKTDIYDCAGRITNEAMANSNAKYLPLNSVIIALNGQGKTRGTVALLRVKATCNQSLISIYPKHINEILPEYIYCNLHGRYDEIRRITGDDGNDRRGLNMPLIRNIEIPLPPLQEQQRIVAILDEAFAAIAQAKANAEQNIKNAKELFESYLQSVFENKGEGWEEKTLGEIAFVKSGGTPSRAKKEYWEGDIAWYSSGELNDLHTKAPERYINELAVNNSNAKVFPKDSLLIGMYDTAALKMSIIDRDAAFNQAIAGVKPNDNIDLIFILHSVNAIKPNLLKLRRGVRQKNLSLQKIKDIPVFLPPLPEQQTIVQKLDALSTETKQLEAIYQQKINDLDELKKSILQKAFAGELNTTALEV